MDELQKSDISLREEEILKTWKEKGIFQKTLAKSSPKGEFVFYEGPPTANARPGIHHLISRAFKDVIPRYKTMRGFHVRRKAGWDTHGLPVEIAVEKSLGLTSKKQIEEYGVAKFNEQCKQDVWKYINEWQEFTERIGYWVDLDDAYITYYPSYIESLWNIIAHVNRRGLLYKDYKVVPWCPRCGTPLSSHELAQGYEDVKDISVYVKFKVVGEGNTYLLAWTTTPWTLPGNVGLAVGEDVSYVKVAVGDEVLWLAKARLSVLEGEYKILEEVSGAKLVGKTYEPLYPFTAEMITGAEKEKMKNAYKVYAADFVTTEDGTGVVHTAVMYGQEDFDLGQKVGLPKHHLVGEDGTFLPGTGIFAGRFVRDEDVAVDVIKDLAGRNLLLKKEKYLHSYPHCWRCKTPLIYYARDSWYIQMSKLRDDLVRENKKINWVPEHIREGRFGEWVREVKDWAISRDRYWGTPLPAWQCACGHREVVGSISELKKRIISRGNTYTFVRHGEAQNNVRNISSSDATAPFHLTEKGRTDIQRVGKKLARKNISTIYASPFVRTQETAEIIADALGKKKTDIVTDARLGDYDFGTFSGGSYNDFLAHETEHFKVYTDKAPGGESYADARRRFAEFLYDVDQKHEGEHIVVVSHGISLEVVPPVVEGMDDRHAKQFIDDIVTNPGDTLTFQFVPLPHNHNFEIDLHKPYIDEVQLACPSCKKVMKRTPEVMDVWFDSGAMPFAQDHYPFEGGTHFWNRQKLAYPAQYISEAIDQTRGWFYTLLAVGVLMEKGSPFENVVCLSHILDSQGKKMSKSLGNTINPWEMIAKYGVDVIRFWMFSVNQPGDTKNFDEKTVDEVNKKVFNILRNVVSFYALHKDGEHAKPNESEHVLDRWILARLDELVAQMTQELDLYHTFEPTRALKDFVSDLSTWYIRRSRDRFRDGGDDAMHALATTRYVLLTLSKLFAPFAPFFAEEMYGAASGEKESVHLEEWPKELGTRNREQILEEMEEARDVVSKALEARSAALIKVRQPLASLTLSPAHIKLAGKEEILAVIADEVNVKEVRFSDGTGLDVALDTAITPELQKEGDVRELIRAIQDFRKESGLKSSDAPKLHVTTDEKGSALINESKEELKKATNLSSISAVVGETEGQQFRFELH
ncbi:MAG: hypothetical protein AMXMBFR44_6380 [Candidatus Campbellbacteria bacterium]